ncbi:MAG: hypothetical protein M1460_04075 [Candidatus Thermoplasmatota archaeon]|jgi:hypothetical protein|nr:hypothetical protein [Candidatus Thermoplasmatota archaeon]
MMTRSINVEDMDYDRAFKLRVEIYLRLSAIRIREHYENPEKFNSYIKEREQIIKELVGDAEVMESGKKIYP